MVEVIFVLRGQTVTLDEIEDARERTVLQTIQSSIRDRVGGKSRPGNERNGGAQTYGMLRFKHTWIPPRHLIVFSRAYS